MGIRSRIDSPKKNTKSLLQEKNYQKERNYRADRLVEKWSGVAEIGKGITAMPTEKARNLAILLENQLNVMSKLNEAQLSNTFYGYTPENMLRIVRLSYPNSIRGDLFTEFAMESAHDSIKYIYPVYTKDAQWGEDGAKNRLDGTRYDDGLLGEAGDAMYEQTESRYPTELVKCAAADGGEGLVFTATVPATYLDGDGQILVDGEVVAMQVRKGNGTSDYKWIGDVTSVAVAGSTMTVTFGEAKTGKTVEVVVRYDSELDMAGQYLGEVELQMRDYHFRPRPITLGVTWTQLTELVLDTSFGLSAEEMLMDSASQEIKKSLDYQAIKYASAMQKIKAAGNFDRFDAEATDAGSTKDSYFHTAQLVQQSIQHIADKQLDDIGRGGVSAIVGGPKAITYLMLNKGWTDKGKQPSIGGHKVGELDGIPVFKAPTAVIGAEDEILTTWKNDTNQGDVSIAIGTLLPFYSTGAIQRKNLYKEQAVARFEDTQALQPKYLGRIKIENIR